MSYIYRRIYRALHSSIVHTCLIKTLYLQALGEDTDFAKPHTMRVIEKFLFDCSETVSKRCPRYDCVIKVISRRGAKDAFFALFDILWF